jgi:anti-anti-sigma factor
MLDPNADRPDTIPTSKSEHPSVAMETTSESEIDRVFLVEFHEGILTVVPLAEASTFQWPEVERASKVIFESIGREQNARVLVDMGRLRYCGSAMLALLLRVWKSVSPDGVLAFCNVNSEVANVLHQTKLDTLWAMYSTREAAQAALRSAASA